MAQLSDDCFAFGGELMAIEQGIALIAERVTPVAETEIVAIEHADGRVLAADIAAPIDIPGFDNSAVDGWAVRHADLAPEGETVMPIAGRIAAGDSGDHEIRPGHAVRIFTGAAMPRGGDTVFMQEDVREDGDRLIVPAGLKHGANRRLAGEDVAVGTPALAAGTRLLPQHVSLAAALGLTELPVRRRLRVAVLSTGDELAAPGTPLAPGALYESNSPLLVALLRRLGAEVTRLGMVADDPARLETVITGAARDHDLILSTGGVSTGEEDHTRRVVERIGRLVLWRLAIKPGRPVAMAVVDGTPFIGLPGNPVAVFVTFTNIVRALIARLSGEAWQPAAPLPVRSTFAYKKKSGRREFVRVSVRTGPDGIAEAVKHPRDGAGVISSLTETTGLAELPDAVTLVEPGDMIGYRSYAEMF